MIKKILNIKFINTYNDLKIDDFRECFIVAPSGPGLSTIDNDRSYYDALMNSDIALPDSGLMVLLTKLVYKIKIKKYSGAKFIRLFFEEYRKINNGHLFLVDPNKYESELNRLFLNNKGINITSQYQYIAPLYIKDKVEDQYLVNKLETLKDKPKFILINLGSGVQEPLGYYLKENLSFHPAIICTGAAISFLTGAQANIPKWADAIYLGWFFRIIQNPSKYLIRYLTAFRLLYVFYKYKKGLIQ